MRTLIGISVFVLAAGGSVHGREIVVGPNDSGEFTEIQPAIDAAEDGDVILVKAGDYVITEPLTFRGKQITVRGESGAEVTTIRMSETPGDEDRASVVIFENGESEESIIEGFLVTGGKGTNWGSEYWQTGGGGILCLNDSSPLLTNCTISGNATLSGNSGAGGGVYCSNSSPNLTNCTISGNWAKWRGGGVHCGEGSSPNLTNCTISANSASFLSSSAAGGVYCSNSSPTLLNCMISGNEGHGVYCFESSPILANCTISGNSSWEGAGMYCGRNSSPTLTNCIIWGNAGGSIGLCVVEKCEDSNPQVSFSCIEGEAVWPGDGNINLDALFIQPGHWDDNGTPDVTWDDSWISGNYQLQSDSPCIDAGTSDRAPTFDIDGNARPCGAGVDMGAYESGGCPSPTFFQRGDVDSDARRNITDPVFTLLFLFAGGAAPPCHKSADADDSGSLEITDAVYLLNHLFLGGPAPAAPFPTCGADPTIDDLTCDSFPPCQ